MTRSAQIASRKSAAQGPSQAAEDPNKRTCNRNGTLGGVGGGRASGSLPGFILSRVVILEYMHALLVVGIILFTIQGQRRDCHTGRALPVQITIAAAGASLSVEGERVVERDERWGDVKRLRRVRHPAAAALSVALSVDLRHLNTPLAAQIARASMKRVLSEVSGASRGLQLGRHWPFRTRLPLGFTGRVLALHDLLLGARVDKDHTDQQQISDLFCS